MIDWSNEHPSHRATTRFHITRVARAGKLSAIILSTEAIGVWTHYWQNRTQPCRAEKCQACAENSSRRRHWYLAIWDPDKNGRALLELTDRAAEQLYPDAAAKPSLRGKRIRAWRVGVKPNAPVELEVSPNPCTEYALPPEPNVVDCLLVTWRLTDDPKAREKGPETITVREHRRVKQPAHASSQQQPVKDDRPDLDGRRRTADRLHELPGQDGGLPSSAATDAALD